jgi:LytS/YehU family sensor histidine kinase
VRVAARRDGEMLEVTVADDGPGIDAAAASVADHGIENTRARLRALYGERAPLVVASTAWAETTGTVATLRVPYRELPREQDDGRR